MRKKERRRIYRKDFSKVTVPNEKKRKEKYMNDYTFEMMYEDLRNGYQIYYTYVKNRYLLFRTAKNCYTQKLISNDSKNPNPKSTVLTLKRVKEMFPYMEDIEYKVTDIV